MLKERPDSTGAKCMTVKARIAVIAAVCCRLSELTRLTQRHSRFGIGTLAVDSNASRSNAIGSLMNRCPLYYFGAGEASQRIAPRLNLKSDNPKRDLLTSN